MFTKKVACLHCGARNSVSRKPKAFARCGRCSRPLIVAERTARPARSKAALRSPWPFFWAITLGLIAGAVWHESDTRKAAIPTVTRNAHADSTIMGRASVIDGDTIEIHGQRIRLWGIDAPEGQQRCTRGGQSWRCGSEAANSLDRYLSAHTVTCVERDRDRYRRIAVCKVRGGDTGAWLVRHGWALDYTRYSGGTYAGQQSQARSERRGMWQGEFEAPWEWRRR